MLHKTYKVNKEALDLAVSTEWSTRERWVEKVGLEEAKESVQAVQKAVAAHETMEADPDRRKKGFNKQWRPAERDYSKDPDAPIMQAEKARDSSMYQHILQAAKNRYPLYGSGELHGQRLQGLLKGHKGIKYMAIRDFIGQQRKKYPQD